MPTLSRHDFIPIWSTNFTLGSPVAVAMPGGAVVRQSFSPWGTPRDPFDWTAPYDTALVAGRGFAGHVHLGAFGLVNMNFAVEREQDEKNFFSIMPSVSKEGAANGRIYDPVLGMFLSPDPYIQAPETVQNFNRYSYCLNNPLKYTDPDGEMAWYVPIIISSAIGGLNGTIKAERYGMKWYDGLWRGALTGAVGGTLSMFGGGTFVANVVWGIGQGVITGGLNAALWGEDVGKGMLYGAAIGGVFAAASSGIEAYGNYKDGHGFRTNEGVINNYINKNQYQDAIDYVQSKYGMLLNYQGQNVNMTYNANLDLDFYGITDRITGNIEIGPSAFGSASDLKATIVHEYAHSVRDRVLDASGDFVSWQYPSGSFVSANSTLVSDGPLGYANEIYNAGKLHIKSQSITPNYNNPLWSEWKKGFKWYYLIPRRYNSPVTLKWY